MTKSEGEEIDRVLREAMSKFIGEKPDPEVMKAEVQKALEKMVADRGHAIIIDDVEVSTTGDKVTFSARLPVPSPIHEMIILEPQIDPPYAPWRNSDGVTHWAGWRHYEGDRRLVLLCNFMHVDTMYCERPGSIITCLECIRWESERMRP